jgi:hypothetical protein
MFERQTICRLIPQARSSRGTLGASLALARNRAELEELALSETSLVGFTGAQHTVEITPFPAAANLSIDLNRAELRNTNTTSPAQNGIVQSPLSLGMMAFQAHRALSYDPIASTTGNVIHLSAGAGARYAQGDVAQLIGATKETIGVVGVSGANYDSYRNCMHARITDVVGDDVTLDRDPGRYLLEDAPSMAPVKGVSAADVVPSLAPIDWFVGFRPRVTNGTLSSDLGETFSGYSARIDGVFRDLVLNGRKAISVNAQQDCLWESIDIGNSWMRIVELAMNSNGTTVRHVRGTLSSWAGKLDGADDVGTFQLSIGENSTDCMFDDFIVSTGCNDGGAGSNACILGYGRNNRIVNSTLCFPAHTGTILGIVSSAAEGFSNDDCGFRDCLIDAPVCTQFFSITDLGAGVNRPYLVDMTFHGAPSVRAGLINGEGCVDGVLRNVHCEAGALGFATPIKGWKIDGCHFPDGYTGLTDDILDQNIFTNNTSDASRRFEELAAAAANRTATSKTSTEPNNVDQVVEFAPGDLVALDEIHFYWDGYASGGGSNVRHVRFATSADGGLTWLGIIDVTETMNAQRFTVSGKINILNNGGGLGVAKSQSGSGMQLTQIPITGANLLATGLMLRVEIWTETSGSVVQNEVEIAGQKAGMRNIEVTQT